MVVADVQSVRGFAELTENSPEDGAMAYSLMQVDGK